MPGRIRQKWRPPLALVIGGTLAAVLCLPLLGVGYFRVAGNILGWGETAWMIGWMAVAATAVLGFLLWRLVLRPVWALTDHAHAVKDGRGDAPLPSHFGTPEFSALGQAVDEMASTLQDREAGLRAYTDHVTHELRSPLTSLLGAAELLDDPALPEPDRQVLLGTVKDAAERMDGLLTALRRLSAARDPVGRGPADLHRAAQGLALPADVHGAVPVPLDATALRAVLEQLAQNAARHGATRLTIICDGKAMRITDNGPGIPPGDRARIFDPFFTTARAKGGSGMGLAITRTMLRAGGADITLDDSDTGAAFTIRF